MKLCIAGYNNRVATLCEHAQELLFYDFQDAQVQAAGRLPAPPGGPAQWAGLLREQEARLLICGGLCRHTQRLLGAADIEVAPWICGSLEAVLDAFVRDALSECLMPGAQHRPGGRGGQGGPGHCAGPYGGRGEGHGPRNCRGKTSGGSKTFLKKGS